MRHRLRLRPDVVEDLSLAADWYDERRAGLGNEFLQVAYQAFDIIARRAGSFPLVHE
jgi:hypothetical protein